MNGGGGKREKKGHNEAARQIVIGSLKEYGHAIGKDVADMLTHLGYSSADKVASAVVLIYAKCNPDLLQRCETVIDGRAYVGIKWKTGLSDDEKDTEKLSFSWSSIRKSK